MVATRDSFGTDWTAANWSGTTSDRFDFSGGGNGSKTFGAAGTSAPLEAALQRVADLALRFAPNDGADNLPYGYTPPSPAAASMAAVSASPSLADEVSFLSGIDNQGNVVAQSFWALDGYAPHKFGSSEAGTGATITVAFASISNFSKTEIATLKQAFALWEAVADVKFKVTTDEVGADVLIERGNDGGAYAGGPFSGVPGQIATYVGQVGISIDTSQYGFDLSGNLESVGGYGFSTVVHELGHALGLGHGGSYDGSVNPATQQFSAYDNRMYSIMSYIDWTQDTARYRGQYPIKGTDWGQYDDGIYEGPRTASHSWMQLDILAIQQLYGKAQNKNTPFTGDDVFGFNSTITGPLAKIFDFSQNKHPVLTIYSQGDNNTLDASGFTQAARIDLGSGKFSSLAGLTNNVAIARGTVVETAVGGDGKDTITGNSRDNTLIGGNNTDTLKGLTGDDTYWVNTKSDIIVEIAGQGTDRVLASSSYTLAAAVSIEKLATTKSTGTKAIDLAGNELAQAITGNNGDNILYGKGGNDALSGRSGDDDLHGGAGNDKLTGGAGDDYFVFDTKLDAKTNIDTITDFDRADDVLALDRAIFTKLGGTEALSKSAFAANTSGKASDGKDRVIYETDTGKLFYDADGSGSGKAVQFALLSNKVGLTTSDFLILV